MAKEEGRFSYVDNYMRTLSSKKGQLQTLGPSIIALMIAGVFLILGLVIIQSMRDTDVVRTGESNAIYNETTATIVNESGAVLAALAYPWSPENFALVGVTNITGPLQLTGNYTFDAATATISFTGDDLGYNSSYWNVTYTFTTGGDAYKDANTSIVGLGTFASFWEIIILAIIITIIIGLLLTLFGGKPRR